MVVPSTRTRVEWGARVSSQRAHVPACGLIIYVASMSIVYYIAVYRVRTNVKPLNRTGNANRQTCVPVGDHVDHLAYS